VKKTLIFAFVAGTVLFMWQFLSFAAINLHEADQRYHPMQDSILADLAAYGLDDAGYMLGQVHNMGPARGAAVTLVLAYIGYTYFIYSDHVWYDIPDHVVHLVDTVVPWTLIGALGGWMHARSRA
jgi:hypothetical protein